MGTDAVTPGDFALEVVKGVVSLIVGLTAGLSVAFLTTRRHASLERDRWAKDSQLAELRWANEAQLEREKQRNEADLEREKVRSEDERRWLVHRRGVYAEVIAAARDVDDALEPAR